MKLIISIAKCLLVWTALSRNFFCHFFIEMIDVNIHLDKQYIHL